MATAKNPNLKPTRQLPPHVQESDLTRDYKNAIPYKEMAELGGEGFTGYLTFYRTKGLGWVLTTLHISNPSRRQSAATVARTYGIGVKDSKVYTVGRGPHVEDTVEIYVTRTNLERLRVYVELWKKGMADASSIRDRISSRRAQGQLHRQNGRSHWDW